jgi:hypothetical protein
VPKNNRFFVDGKTANQLAKETGLTSQFLYRVYSKSGPEGVRQRIKEILSGVKCKSRTCSVMIVKPKPSQYYCCDECRLEERRTRYHEEKVWYGACKCGKPRKKGRKYCSDACKIKAKKAQRERKQQEDFNLQLDAKRIFYRNKKCLSCLDYDMCLEQNAVTDTNKWAIDKGELCYREDRKIDVPETRGLIVV